MRIQKSAIGFTVCVVAGLTLTPLAANATTVTWNFNPSSIGLKPGPQGNSEIFDGVFNPPTGRVAPITAYGYEEQTTTGGCSNYDRSHSYRSKPTGLYGKGTSNIGSESGLGINGDTDDEIDTIVTTTKTGCQTERTVFQSFIQLDLTNVLKNFPNAHASITIGSVQGPDTAVISYSNKLGTIGTKIAEVKSSPSGVNSITGSLSDFSLADPYLTISSIVPSSCCCSFTSSVLLDSCQLSYTPTSTATPEPAAAGLLGFAAMGLLLVPRRRTK